MPGPLPVRMQRAQLFLAWPGGVAVGAALLGRPMVWAGATVLACALGRRPVVR